MDMIGLRQGEKMCGYDRSKARRKDVWAEIGVRQGEQFDDGLLVVRKSFSIRLYISF